jgi:hypothetical protein
MRRARRSRGTPLGSAPPSGPAGPSVPNFTAPTTPNPGVTWSGLTMYHQGQPIPGSALERARISVTNTLLGTSVAAQQPRPPPPMTTTTTLISGATASTVTPTASAPMMQMQTQAPPPPLMRFGTVEEDGDAEDEHELFPAMADDDYSAQLSWQSQTKENLKSIHFYLLVSTRPRRCERCADG